MGSLPGKDKDRLYIALYDLRGVLGGGIPREEGDYQWALLSTPKTEVADTMGERWLMRQRPADRSSQTTWKVESDKVRLKSHDSIIARIMIAKVTDRNRLAGILSISQLSGGELQATQPSTTTEQQRTHKTWIRDIVTALREDGKCCKHLPTWQDIERTCMEHAPKVVPSSDIDTLDMISGSSGKAGSKQPLKVRP